MNWTVTILALIFVTLLAIAAELRLILQEMRAARTRTEPPVAPREIPGAGQTINVNLSPLSSLSPALTVSPGSATAPGTVTTPEGQALAAEDAANGLTETEILSRLDSAISRTRIYVSVSTLKNMLRGGRIGKIKGFLATVSGLKPVVSLDAEGKGIASGASFSLAGSRRRIFRAIRREKGEIGRYAVVHAGAPERAAAWAADLTALLGKCPDYVMEIAPAVALQAGQGAVAVAYTLKDPKR